MDCRNSIVQGNVVDVQEKLPKAVFNCCVTSPPYWGLRAYQTTPVVWGGDKNCRHKWQATPPRRQRGGTDCVKSKKQVTNVGSYYEAQSGLFCSLCNAWRGELGLEPTPELYIDHLMTVFDGVKRVLRKDGVLFVNIGDTYGTSSGAGSRAAYKQGTNKGSNYYEKTGKPGLPGLEKSLCAIPERFVLAMMAHGWIRRCTIIWAKGLSFCETYSGSCMPDSAKDRPNKNGFEYVYMFTKSKKYFYEQVFEEMVCPERYDYPFGYLNQEKRDEVMASSLVGDRDPNHLGRTIRNVWTINPQAFSEAHFATFPEKLVEICLKLGCPEFVCKKCGLPRKKIYNVDYIPTGGKGQEKYDTDNQSGGLERGQCTPQSMKHGRANKQSIEAGLTDCGCGEGFRPGIMFDPFSGSGTVPLVAYNNRRDYCGIELSKDYVRMSEARLDEARSQYSLLEAQ